MRRCVRCVMTDESDPFIKFDEKGQCSYCTEALKLKQTTYFPGKAGRIKLNALLAEVSRERERERE